MKSILFFSVMLSVAGIVFSQSEGDFTYEFVGSGSDRTVTITKYTGNALDVVIPSHINGSPVTVIGRWCFSGSDITSIVFPNTLKEIGVGAFIGTKLTEVQFPDSLEIIGMTAFGKCHNLERINIPKNIKEIGPFAFDCTDLYGSLNVSVRNELIERFGEDVFYCPL